MSKDFIYFAENVCGVKLSESQKEMLLQLYEVYKKDGVFVIYRHQGKQLLQNILINYEFWLKDQRIENLEKQLEEKDKEIEHKNYECKKWQRYYENCSELEKTVSKERQYCLDNWRACKKEKTAFAIEQLINIQKYISYNAVFIEEKAFAETINEYIDNQIKELKENKQYE